MVGSRARGKKADILAAARSLFWERGFEATSPRAVMQKSGAGQGSLYHHFPSKKALGVAVLDALESELTEAAETLLAPRAGEPLGRILAYLLTPRRGTRGCKLGRFANETTVIADPDLRAPITRYFTVLARLLEDAFVEAHNRGTLSSSVEPAAAAATIVAMVQGAYVLARCTDETQLTAALRGAAQLVEGWRK